MIHLAAIMITDAAQNPRDAAPGWGAHVLHRTVQQAGTQTLANRPNATLRNSRCSPWYGVYVPCSALQHAGPHALVVHPVGHSLHHVRQQSGCPVDELAEFVHLQAQAQWLADEVLVIQAGTRVEFCESG